MYFIKKTNSITCLNICILQYIILIDIFLVYKQIIFILYITIIQLSLSTILYPITIQGIHIISVYYLHFNQIIKYI